MTSERPEQLRREIAQLELRQQTTALSLQDENELIGRIRELARRFADAEKRRSEIMARHTQRQVLEENFQAARAEVERLGHETIGVKNVREAAMARMQGVHVEIGQIVGQIRDLSRQRGRVMDHVDEVTRQINDLERGLRSDPRAIARPPRRSARYGAALRQGKWGPFGVLGSGFRGRCPAGRTHEAGPGHARRLKPPATGRC